MITCQNCGEITKEDVKLYDESLKKQNIGILPVYPTCELCGAEAAISHTCISGNIIVQNGTCGEEEEIIESIKTGSSRCVMKITHC